MYSIILYSLVKSKPVLVNEKTQPNIGGQKNPNFEHPNYKSSEVFYQGKPS